MSPVKERGKNLPSEKNLADYIDKQDFFEMLHFHKNHAEFFNELWIVAQQYAATGVTEAGCERFFGLSGYVSSPSVQDLLFKITKIGNVSFSPSQGLY